MLNEKAGESGAMSMGQMEDAAINLVEFLCSVVSRPVELILRPWHGTRYFAVPVIAFSTFLMILMPVLGALFTGVVSMIPFSHASPPIELFGIVTATKLYFLLSMFHGIRHYRLMIHMEREQHSEYEGPALPFFALIPRSGSFWFTRIVLEPAFVLIVATALGRIFIFQSGLTLYLQCAALALMMKNFIGWYKAWQYIRTLMDARFASPIIAKMADNRATESDLATIHLASFPSNVDPDIRADAVSQIARNLSR
jgi:hypothetical protein